VHTNIDLKFHITY